MIRLLFIIALSGAFLFSLAVWDVADPQLRTDMALDQFANPSIQTDTIMRRYPLLKGYYTFGGLVTLAGLSCVLFRKELKEMV